MDNTMINTTTDVTNNTVVNDHTFAKGVGTGVALTTLVFGIAKGITAISKMVKLKKELDDMTVDYVDNGVPTEVMPEKE